MIDNILARARFLHYENTERSKFDISRQAITEVATADELRQIYTLFDVDYATLLQSIAREL